MMCGRVRGEDRGGGPVSNQYLGDLGAREVWIRGSEARGRGNLVQSASELDSGEGFNGYFEGG